MISKTRNNIEPKMAIAALFLFICLMTDGEGTYAFDLKRDLKSAVSVGMAYSVHIFFHELGHQLVADDVGAVGHKMSFFTYNNGTFYPGLSQYKSIPDKSKLPYAIGGERMSAFTFEYALQSFREKPTMFNKALLLFSSVDFLAYTVLANYVNPENDMYDPNLIRAETGMSKELILAPKSCCYQ